VAVVLSYLQGEAVVDIVMRIDHAALLEERLF
jgi:hypothetical protein